MSRRVPPRQDTKKDTVNKVCIGCGNSFTRDVGFRQVNTTKYCSESCLRRAKHLRTRYGITFETVNEILIKQNNLCLICKVDLDTLTDKEINIDHCHLTGEIRGILCAPCNMGLGNFKDNVEALKAAVKYLENI